MTPDGKWCSVEEAVGIAGCTDGLIRLRLREGRLEGWKANERAWMVSVQGCHALRQELAPHSNARKAEAAAKESASKASRKRRKSR
ncbi:MAG TPA: hypothetical protein VLA31_05460 [Burkholderiaceae bacterium]|nr:hypothetical protein [Burkholderiaceae bacterium]